MVVNGSKFVKDFQLTFNGINLKGKVRNVTPVNVISEFENIRPGGVEGVLPVRVGLAALEFGFTVYGYEEGLLTRSGLHQNGAFTDLSMNWVIEDENGDKTSVIIQAEGAVTSVDRGQIENGQLNEISIGMTLTRYKEEYNGELVYDIDVYDGSRTNIIGGINVAQQTLDILNQVGAIN